MNAAVKEETTWAQWYCVNELRWSALGQLEVKWGRYKIVVATTFMVDPPVYEFEWRPVPIAEGKPQQAKANYIGAPAAFKLELAAKQLYAAFGDFGIYQVGSSLQRPDWRDVDLVYILSDADFAALFPDAGTHFEFDERWLLLTVSLSQWLSEQTGLPIDFKFQPQTHANERHPNKSRNAIGLHVIESKSVEDDEE